MNLPVVADVVRQQRLTDVGKVEIDREAVEVIGFRM